MLQGVRGARVHLVLPKRQPFSRDVQAASASVILTMTGAARLDVQGVQAVLNLVAAAVPGLKTQGIAIIDSRGNLLARAGQPTGDEAVIQTTEEVRRATELRLSRAVEEMLEQSLGQGRVRAEAAVEMNFDRMNETAESFNPDQQVVRSTQTSTDKSNSTEADKAVTVQNNLPNANAGQTQSGSQQQKQDETINYEIGKTVRTIVREQPQISHISLAVMVDGASQLGRDGKPTWTERGAEDIARIKLLVESAIGYNEKRGDKVEVVSMRFATPDDTTLPVTGLLGLNLERSDLLGMGQSAILAIVVLLALIFVLRPMALRLSSVAAQTSLAGDVALLARPGNTSLIAPLQLSGSAGGSMTSAMLADESMINIVNVEGQLRASSLRRLSDMVEKHPDESLAIIRSWLTQEPK